MAKTVLRFPVSRPVLAGKEQEYVREALASGWISSIGPFIGRFEEAASSYLGLEGGVAVSNGTVALHLACLAMGLGPGMDVVVPSLTFVASANAVKYCGASPAFADSDPLTWNATPQTIAAAWTPRTVGVILVHLYGLPAPAREVAELCRERGAWLIEDCAQGFGAAIDGRGVGSFGDAATFSFFGNKIISTGEGGMVFARSGGDRGLIRQLRGQGMDPQRRYWHPIVGYNYRLTNVAAAIGLGQVEMADYHIGERRRIARRYRRNLAPLARRGLLRLPAEPAGYTNVHWLFSVVFTAGGAEARDRIADGLLQRHGIETRPFFVPMHQLPPYAGGPALPNAEFVSCHGINLPTYSGLEDAAVDEISEAVAEAARGELRRRRAA